MSDDSYWKKQPIIPPPFRNYLFKQMNEQPNSAIIHHQLILPTENEDENTIEPVIHDQKIYYRMSDAIKKIKAELDQKDQEIRDQFIKDLIKDLAPDQTESMTKETENMYF